MAVSSPVVPGSHQAALLHLSSVHVAFQQPQEALQALGEALKQAQAAGSPVSMMHCLAGLCQVLGQATGMTRGGGGGEGGGADMGLGQQQELGQLMDMLRWVGREPGGVQWGLRVSTEGLGGGG